MIAGGRGMTNHGEQDTEPTLLFETQSGVATLTLHRPAARNALTAGCFLEARNQKFAGRSQDVREGIRAFRENRKPEFRGR